MQSIHELPQRVDRLPGLDSLLGALVTRTVCAQIEGLAGPAKGLVIARLFERVQPRLLLVTYQAEQAQRLLDDFRQFGLPEDRLFLIPALESRWLSGDATDHVAVSDRITALTALAGSEACIVIGTADAVFQRTAPPADLSGHSIELTVGGAVELDRLVRSLSDMGYDSETSVSRPGQFAKRGGLLDVYPSTASAPVRVELFGDEVESLRAFDVSTQRSTGQVDHVLIRPAHEVRLATENVNRAVTAIRADLRRRQEELARLGRRDALDLLAERVEDDVTRIQSGMYFDGLDAYLCYLSPEPFCAVDYMTGDARRESANGDAIAHPPSPIVILDEPAQIQAHWERLRSEIAESRARRFDRGEILRGDDPSIGCNEGMTRATEDLPSLILSQLPRTYEGMPVSRKLSVSTAPLETYRSRLSFLAEEVGTWQANGAECLIATDQPQRVREICRELKLAVVSAGAPGERARGESPDLRPSPPPVQVVEGRLRQGFKFADIGLYVVTDAELFGSTRPIVSRRRATGGIPISTILDLRENDFVVHIHHGIGVYRGLVKRRVDNADRDYLQIDYAGGDRLFVPADQIDRVQRYIGGQGAPPTVNRIGGNDWQRTTRRVKEQAREMARELIELYAARQAAERPSLGDDTPWQHEMEEAFPYEETPSQLHAIEDVKADLEETKPMDRLVCGDVGFGKTEVAIRAAFKVVESGKQVAVLCPTTVLAAQHHTTFSERLAAYPIRIELLSRFRSRQEQKLTVEALKAGAVDVVVGTHRLLSKDVEFRNLGLIIVDEEQRFGVAHKERLKQLRKTVDVLTLTATPIPRTLSMALSGLRDMSVIEDPPSGRLPIITRVSEYDEELVRDALLRELERDGQIYFVHNRIESIDHVAQRVQKLVPEAQIRVGHGQMSEDELEKIMYDFYHRAFDILVCTTIIENGLDIPNVNTIVVDRADRMGLAQLYQLRGRVGRSNRQAYAYLLYRPSQQLTEIAENRLMAIREFTALGSGFQIAMRDLEIRGAGNLLGPEQSGAMVSVGFDLYCQLLAQAVSEMKGEEPADDTLPPADLPVTAHIPEGYIPNEAERIFFYKRMSGVRSTADVDALREELEDRYGDPPRAVWNALAVLRLRLRARQAGIASIRGERAEVAIRLAPHARLHPDAIRLLTYAFKGHRFTSDSVIVPLRTPRVMEEVEEMVNVLERATQYGRSDARVPTAAGRS